jgi:hypothetical protein
LEHASKQVIMAYYKESLVDGSRVLIDIRSFLKSQIEKSKIMNEGKVGAPL